MDRQTLTRIFSDPPHLKTDRLLLRRMMKSDKYDMYEYAKQEIVTRYLLWEPHLNEAYTLRYLTYLQGRYKAGEFYDWAVVLRNSYKMIGTCGFTRISLENNSGEIGYVLNPLYWHEGFGTEAAERVLRFGFDTLKLNRIEAKYMLGNDISRKVMEKIGMTFEGVSREAMYVKGEYVSVGTCAILADEYYAKHMPMVEDWSRY